MKDPEIKILSEEALTVVFGDEISEEINSLVIALHNRLQPESFPGFIESVPAYSSLTVYYDPRIISSLFPYRAQSISEIAKTYIRTAIAEMNPASGNRQQPISVPVCYEGPCAPDMDFVVHQSGLDAADIVRLHASVSYTVFFIGFIPGFPYLGTNPERLNVPRKKIPSVSVPAGSVALAGIQSGIYPFAVPGGWQVIGRTPWQIFDKAKDPCCSFSPGEKIRFVPISYSEYLAQSPA